MGKHREVIEILADVLKAAGSGTTKTRIMFRANLSYKLLEKYLGMTVESGLIDFGGSYYRLSKSGKAFLDAYNSYLSRHSMVKGHLQELDVERERLEQIYQGSNGNRVVKQFPR
jgi:predicted transcriptional regulator